MRINAYGVQASGGRDYKGQQGSADDEITTGKCNKAYNPAKEGPVLCLHLAPKMTITITISDSAQSTIENKVDKIMALDQAIKDLALTLVATAEENRKNMVAVIAKFEELKNGASAAEIAELLAQLQEVNADAQEVKTGLVALVTAVPELPDPPDEGEPV